MEPTTAQVLTTLAHELRSPVAVCRGYVKLWLDGRLGSADEQRRAMQQTFEAIGRLADLCGEMGRLATVSETEAPPLVQQVPVPFLLDALRAAPELMGVAWLGAGPSARVVATWSLPELVSAVAILLRVGVDQTRGRPTAVAVGAGADNTLALHAGDAANLTRMAEGDHGALAAPFNVVRGGQGLSIIWATIIAARHGVQIWQLAGPGAAIGLRIPLVDS